MFLQLVEGALLVASTVAIHSVVLAWIMVRLEHRPNAAVASFIRDALLLSRIAVWCVLAHLAEIVLWGGYYVWREAIPDLELSFYFSAVTYATIGYGDVVPPENWRLIASMEGLTGILMCAWSGGFFFAVATRLYDLGMKPRAGVSGAR